MLIMNVWIISLRSALTGSRASFAAQVGPVKNFSGDPAQEFFRPGKFSCQGRILGPHVHLQLVT
jgi:hypothetical protein